MAAKKAQYTWSVQKLILVQKRWVKKREEEKMKTEEHDEKFVNMISVINRI